MKPRNRITIAQSQRLSLNLSLQTAISVLKADAGALTAWLEEEAARNPQLELLAPPAIPAPWAPRWHDALSRLRGTAGGIEVLAAPAHGLHTHITTELRLLRLQPQEMTLAEALIGQLEPSGWLAIPPERFARQSGTPLAKVEALLAKLQTLSPTGIFARDLGDCLRLQAIEAGEYDPVMAVILQNLPLIAAGEIGMLATRAGTTPAAITARIRQIRRYDPKPGARFQTGAAPVIEPDLLLCDGPEGAELSLNRSALPSVSLAPARGKTGTPGDRQAAREVIRQLESRNHTLLRIASEMLRRQPQLTRQGLRALLPMTMGEVATALGLHQSTVSRMVQGTSVDTAQGTFWLRAMFSQAVRRDGPSGAAMRDAMAQMIAGEDPAAPLSDADLAGALAGAGAPLARRTIAKYREALGIPTASRRKQAAKLSSATRNPVPMVAPGGDPPHGAQ